MELICSQHQEKVILYCDRNDCSFQRIFLCSQCIPVQLQHLNKHNPLKQIKVISQFFNQPSCIANGQSDDLDFRNSKSTKIGQFGNHIKNQKYKINNLIQDLGKLYNQGCSDLAKELQGLLDIQEQIFQQNFNRYQQETTHDKQADAQLPTLDEILQKLREIQDKKQIERYLKNELRKKQCWKQASNQLKTYGKQSQNFYKDLIIEHFDKKPKFANQPRIIKRWTNGLKALIDSIKNQFQFQDGMANRQNTINLPVQRDHDLALLTPKMVRNQTRLNLHYEGSFSGQFVCNQLNELQNLKYLSLCLSKLDLKPANIANFGKGLIKLQNLSHLYISFEGINTNQNIFKELDLAVNNKKLTELIFKLAAAKINHQSIKAIASILNHQKLESFTLDCTMNQIKAGGCKELAQALGSQDRLRNLTLKFGGFAASKNSIGDEGAIQIFKSIRNLSKLKRLILDFSYNNLSDESISQLAISMAGLSGLIFLQINISNNHIHEFGGMKLLKGIKKSKTGIVKLNMNNTNLGDGFIKELGSQLSKFKSLSSLNLSIKNIETSKKIRDVKEDLKNQTLQVCQINY